MFCPVCKAKVPDGVELCFHCSSKIKDSETVGEGSDQENKQPLSIEKISKDLQMPVSAFFMYGLSIVFVLNALYKYITFISGDSLDFLHTNYFTGFIALGIFFALIGSTIVIVEAIKSLKG